jgi:hypothetical protein
MRQIDVCREVALLRLYLWMCCNHYVNWYYIRSWGLVAGDKKQIQQISLIEETVMMKQMILYLQQSLEVWMMSIKLSCTKSLYNGIMDTLSLPNFHC